MIMARVTLNIAKSYDNGFIAEFEKTKYFQLQKNATTRADIYHFAIALALLEGKEPTPPQTVGPVDSFVRTEYLTNYEALLSCLYYEHNLKDTPDLIDEICNRDEVYALAEQLANSGFGVLKKYVETLDEEALCYKLISYMDKTYNEIINDVNALLG